jgi:colanic acid/amylovoran biosynthesis protein
MARARLATRLGPWLSPPLSMLGRSTVMLDISGGDSFTDLYGPRRFREISGLKRVTVDVGTPLILLPQTYGPFLRSSSVALAGHLVRSARMAWARDPRSFEILKELLGASFDPSVHRCGVDVAFLLPASGATRLRGPGVGEVAGINVSGLIWNDPALAVSRYRFVADYRRVIKAVVERVAAEMPVVLVPHVLTGPGHYESDRDACEALVQELPPTLRERVTVCGDPADPCEAKGLIASCSWFLGTRMHATIAALSSGVPTSAIAYSDKTLGVFETCGQGEHVHDPRKLSSGDLIARVIRSFEDRRIATASLATCLPAVLRRANEQMDLIAASIQGAISDRGAPES